MALNDDVKKQVDSLVTDWKQFLDFLDGFSLDKEIDDEAAKMKEKTLKLESSLAGSTSAAAVDDDIYDDTLVPDTSDPVMEDIYEIDNDVTPTKVEQQQQPDKMTKKSSKKEKAKSKAKTTKEAKEKKTPSIEEDESLSSGGSLKDNIAESIASVTWKITEEKDCSISGRLTKRTNPAAFALFPTSKVFAAIHGGIFYFFDKTTSKKQKGAFHIADYKARPYEQQKKSKQKDHILQCEAQGKPTYYFSTQTEEPMMKWIDMFNKLAKTAAASKETAKTGAMTSHEEDATQEDIYEMDDQPFVESKKANGMIVVEDDEDMDDIYSDPIMDDLEDKIEECPPSPPSRDKNPKPPSPPPARTVTLREKPKVPPPRDDTASDIYDDGTSTLPAPPQSWIKDGDNDQSENVDEIYDDALSVETPAAAVPTKTNPVDTFFYGMWDCKGSSDNELEFHHGDMIEIIERRYDNDGWWVGHLKGKVGLVPKAFLSPAYRKI